MAKICDYQELRLDDLNIGKGQVRVQEPGKEIDTLAESINRLGLLQPIIVCKARDEGKWEILAGQRRFLAHKLLKRDTIYAAILDERVTPEQAKAISITENLLRRKLSGKDLKDGITFLYNHYGTIKDVRAATGLPYKTIRDNVKYPRLHARLKELVDSGTVDINAAIKAQDAAVDENDAVDPDLAVKLATDLHTMTGPQRKKFTDTHTAHPNLPPDEALEKAKSAAKVVQIITTITQDVHIALQKFAREEEKNQDEAAAELIEEALAGHGYIED
ncbi:MAG: ParB/RepB/Spo0J family partition protein [Rhodobacteraceae bacterium]|nr:ParB/RepB/Spo0J family partition protein [Paracoccaceae bacterium]